MPTCRSVPPLKKSWLASNAPILLLAILPLAVVIGVLVGKSGGSGSDSKLLAAIRDVKPVTAASSAPAAATTATASATSVASDFSLSKGFAIQLSTTDAAGVSGAKQAARSNGASNVGVINPKDFTVKHASGSSYIVYSGQFKTRAAAEKALGMLKKKFPGAHVIEVTAKGTTR